MLRALWAGLTALIFIVGAFGFVHWEQSQPTKETRQERIETPKKETKASKAKQGTTENPLIVQVIPHSEPGPAIAKSEHGDHSPEWNLVYITIFLTGFTFGLMIYTAMLWNSTRALVIGAEEVSKKELRAYMAMEHIWFSTETRQLMAGQTLEQMVKPVNIRIRNYGKTPAFETSIWCDGNTTKPTEFSARSPGAGKQMLHPNNHFSIAVSQPETPGPYKRDGDGGWIWGHLIYRDAFDRWWRTNFFWRYHPPMDGVGIGLFSPETEHNEEKGPYKTEEKALEQA